MTSNQSALVEILRSTHATLQHCCGAEICQPLGDRIDRFAQTPFPDGPMTGNTVFVSALELMVDLLRAAGQGMAR